MTLSLLPANLYAKTIETWNEIQTVGGCRLRIEGKTNTVAKTSTATVTFVGLEDKGITDFTLPSSVDYYDYYLGGKKYSASVNYYAVGAVSECDALITATLKARLKGEENMFHSNPNLESINLAGGIFPSNPEYVYRFVCNCPNLKWVAGYADGLICKEVSSKNAILLYPPAKTDATFDLTKYDKVYPGAFRGISNLFGFTCSNLDSKEFAIVDEALYDKSVSTLIAAVNTPDGIMNIPASVTAIGNFSTAAANLKEFNTEPGANLVAKNGVLYNDSGKLLAYPIAKPDKIFIVEEGSIDRYAFYYPQHLTILVDLTDAYKDYASYLPAETTLLVKEEYLKKACEYHANSKSVSSWLTNENCNTGSYEASVSLPEGWQPISVRFASQDLEYHTARIDMKDGILKADGLWPNTKYEVFLTCKDEVGSSFEIPVSFKTAGVTMEYVEATQTTIKIKIDTGDTQIPISIRDEKNLKSGEVILKGLRPGREYTLQPYGKYEDHYTFNAGSELIATTKTLGLSLDPVEVVPTSIRLMCKWIEGDAHVEDYSITFDNEIISSNSPYGIVVGLTPQSSYSFKAIATLENGNNVSCTNTLTTSALELTTLKPKCVAEGCVIVAAETNISDFEPNVGFEWRKIDAPESVPSDEAYSVVCDGTLEGYIKNLQATYYNVRPFYKDNTGIYYYGEWIGFDPANWSFFEPTIRTYPVEALTANTASVRGYVLPGTDAILSQGFQYWRSGSSKSKAMAPASSQITTVISTGQMMTATFDNLLANTEYTYRVFVETKDGFVYGDEQTFTTEEDYSGVDSIADSPEITIVGYFNLQGLRFDKPQPGVNIIVYSDGTSKKVYHRL